MKFLCLGHASYDITFQTDKYPKENTKTRLSTTISCGGGPASNAAYLLGKWGCDVSFSGIVGNDYYGKKIVSEFEKVGVDTTFLEQSDLANTILAFIIANTQNGSRTILSAKDENPLALSLKPLGQYDVILLDGEEPAIAKEVLKQNPKALTIIDAGSYRPSTVSLCPLVQYVVCSHDFAEAYTHLKIDDEKMQSIISIYEVLKRDFQNEIIITLEGKGAFLKVDGMYQIIPSISVPVVDSTGAGDIFHGAFTYFLANGYSLKKTVRLSNIAGALSVQKLGGRFSIPNLDEVLKVEREQDDLEYDTLD